MSGGPGRTASPRLLHGNEVYWKTAGTERSTATTRPYRTLVTYKETWDYPSRGSWIRRAGRGVDRDVA